ncbi:MAG: WD40/YVTN/BNR-like repeat-containing protein, partial [Caldisericaceae bacterium]
MIKKAVFYLLICFLVFSYGLSAAALSVLNKVTSLPYQVTTIFSENEKVFVGTDNGLYVSLNSGKTFTQKNKGLEDLSISGVTKVNDTVFIGTKNGGLYSGKYNADSWSSLSAKVDCPTVTSVNSDGSTIYVTSVCSGFHVSFDGGTTWVERNGGLPTLRTTSFLKAPSGRCFLGTDHFGLFYSDNLGETCNWSNILKDYSITSLSYLGSSLFVGTNQGMFTAPISNPTALKSISVKAGNPYVLSLLNYSNRIFVVLSTFGVYSSANGTAFYPLFPDTLTSPSAIFIDGATRNMYFGDTNGNVFSVNLGNPVLLPNNIIDLGTIQKGSTFEGKIPIENAGSGILSGTINAPSFVKFSSTSFSAATL